MLNARVTLQIPGVNHGAAPIPMGAMIGGHLHSSGIPPVDPANGTIPADGARQVELAFLNAAALLDQATLTVNDVLYLEIWLGDESLRDVVNHHWLSWYPDAQDRPARHILMRALPEKMVIQIQLQALGSKAV